MGYDYLRRLSTVTGGIYSKTYQYRDLSSTKTTTQVASLTYDLPTDLTFAYTYDNMGNIASYTDANGTVTYAYDAQGQLLSASNGLQRRLNVGLRYRRLSSIRKESIMGCVHARPE